MHKNIALITGASSGIGRDISIELAKQGFEVILSSRDMDKLNETCLLVEEVGGKGYVVAADFSDVKSIESLYYESLKIGFVDTVINNAGFGKFDKIGDISIDDWDSQISVNLRAPFLITKLFSKNMVKNKKGMFVYINSVAGKKAYPYSSAYVSSKFGLLGFSRSVREEFRQDNIKVVSVHPGAIDTGFWDHLNVDFPREEMMSSSSIAKHVIQCICVSENVVVEEIDIQRTKGDF